LSFDVLFTHLFLWVSVLHMKDSGATESVQHTMLSIGLGCWLFSFRTRWRSWVPRRHPFNSRCASHDCMQRWQP